MTLVIDLPPELETQLQVAAARSGQDVQTFATAALAQASLLPGSFGATVVLHRADGTIQSSLTSTSLLELDSALDELEAIGANIPAPQESIAHSREDIYFEHD